MSEETISTDTVAKATELGWAPKDKWRGEPDKWQDADAYVAESERIMPHLRRTNESLRGDLTRVNGEVARLTSALTESQSAIKEMATGYEEIMAERIKSAKTKLYREMAEARKDDNIEGEIAAQEGLDRLNQAERVAKAKPQQQQKEAPTGVDPALQAWVDRNPWYAGSSSEDRKRTRLFQAAFAEARGESPSMSVQGLLEKAKATMEGDLQESRPGVDRSEGGGGGGGGYGAGGNGRGYADLPAEAKEVCNKQAARFVGEGRAYKTQKDWQDTYARIYFETE